MVSKETANLQASRGEEAGRTNPPASLCSQVPFSYWSLPMAEPHPEPERPGRPLVSDAARGAGRTRLDREAGGTTRKHPGRSFLVKKASAGPRGGEFVRGETGPFPTRGKDPGWQVNGNEGVAQFPCKEERQTPADPKMDDG